jgi:hypothetical protein
MPEAVQSVDSTHSGASVAARGTPGADPAAVLLLVRPMHTPRTIQRSAREEVHRAAPGPSAKR